MRERQERTLGLLTLSGIGPGQLLFGKVLLALASGATHKTVYFPTVKAFRIAAPPIDEQRRIVAQLETRLEAIDRARAGLDAELEALDALPGALLRQAFAG